MTLTVCVGSSGSGKTYFLNEVYESHKCTYIRQFHNVRPYIIICKIPGFDPTQLPFWDIYEREGTAGKIMAGGTMAGQFTAGLSGGQRKMLLFELIVQRTANQSDLLIVLDEPFAGVTDDFVPFITQRLHQMSQKHNILLVTNDHVETLMKQADNIITVSAIDRSKLKVNDHEKVPREKVILAMALGDDYSHKLGASHADLRFFWDVEVAHNGALMGIAVFTIFTFALFLATFWDSSEESGALILIAGGIIAFFCVNPYLMALVEWRNAMNEEAAALVHASKGMNKALKTVLTISIIFIVSWIEFGVVNAVVDGFEQIDFWVAMFFDSMSLTFTLICLGLYSHLDFQTAQILGSLPFLLMIFLSTTFSPGSGVPGLKELRYLYARFYFWCMVPAVQDSMEGCPGNLNLLYLVLSALIGLFIFLVVIGILKIKKGQQKAVQEKSRRASMMDSEFQQLQKELYGDKLKQLKHMNTSGVDLSLAERREPPLTDEPSEQPTTQTPLVETEAPDDEKEAQESHESTVQPTATESVKAEAQKEEPEFWC